MLDSKDGKNQVSDIGSEVSNELLEDSKVDQEAETDWVLFL